MRRLIGDGSVWYSFFPMRKGVVDEKLGGGGVEMIVIAVLWSWGEGGFEMIGLLYLSFRCNLERVYIER